MKRTELLETILERAEAMRAEFNSEALRLFHVAAAFAEFCATQYTGFCVSDKSVYPNWYEEERLRLLYGKTLKYTSIFRHRLGKRIREGGREKTFGFAFCEKIAAQRNNDVLSADLVLLCVLTELGQDYHPFYRERIDEETIIPLLEYADDNVYGYTAKSIEAICGSLMEKANWAAAKRDWKPAAKFVEPEMLIRLALEGIETGRSGNVMTIKIPKFFGSAGLTLSIHRVDDVYYVHDNRCALRHLARVIRDAEKYERAVRKVCHTCRIDKGRITGSFSNPAGFMYYIKDLVFVAQADLYYPRAMRQLCIRDRGYAYIPADRAEPFDDAELLGMLRESVNAYYDEMCGLCLWLRAGNSPFQTRYSFLVENLDDHRIRFSDRLKGQYEGELLEPCYWYHESTDISGYCRFFDRFAERFGAEFDGQNIYLTEKTKNFQPALFRFFQLAVLVSAVGHSIALPKGRQKG